MDNKSYRQERAGQKKSILFFGQVLRRSVGDRPETKRGAGGLKGD